eukprot:Sspe_Gene.64787::Locus_38382_Transcript_1_1_Confidence_1.000_Length_596::g.64787::m.64787
MPFGMEGEEDSLCPSLTWKQRAIGFGSCLVVGFLLSILSWVSIVNRNFGQFGLFCSFANIISVAGSCFLVGPLKQVKRMFEEKRLEATVIFVVSMIWTIIAALWLEEVAIVILMCIVQYLAMIWYGLSYIPFARDVVKKCFGGLFK